MAGQKRSGFILYLTSGCYSWDVISCLRGKGGQISRKDACKNVARGKGTVKAQSLLFLFPNFRKRRGLSLPAGNISRYIYIYICGDIFFKKSNATLLSCSLSP